MFGVATRVLMESISVIRFLVDVRCELTITKLKPNVQELGILIDLLGLECQVQSISLGTLLTNAVEPNHKIF